MPIVLQKFVHNVCIAKLPVLLDDKIGITHRAIALLAVHHQFKVVFAYPP